MAKTKEELNALKQELEALTTKLNELTEDELNQIAGGLEVAKRIKEKLCYVALDPEDKKAVASVGLYKETVVK